MGTIIQTNIFVMATKFFICLLITFSLLSCSHVDAQCIDETVVNITDKKNLDLELDDFIEKKFYKDPSEELKVVFTLKIDSLGEIHSAHIRWNRNLKLEEYYTICHELELKYKVKFMYDKYKSDFLGERYVICRYPYFSNRNE